VRIDCALRVRSLFRVCSVVSCSACARFGMRARVICSAPVHFPGRVRSAVPLCLRMLRARAFVCAFLFCACVLCPERVRGLLCVRDLRVRALPCASARLFLSAGAPFVFALFSVCPRSLCVY
jgi:hypothetical protein